MFKQTGQVDVAAATSTCPVCLNMSGYVAEFQTFTTLSDSGFRRVLLLASNHLGVRVTDINKRTVLNPKET